VAVVYRKVALGLETVVCEMRDENIAL